MADGGIINISGGEISATGGATGAGIGGGGKGNGGQITITGGEILAESEQYGAGIGGGVMADGGTINISGGKISAQGGEWGAGIGGGVKIDEQGGNGGEITISGGTISAAGGTDATAIGEGKDGNGGTIQITGGSINATSDTIAISPAPTDGENLVYLNILTAPAGFLNSPVTAFYINSSYGINDVVTDGEGKLYFYLPATHSEELIAVTFDPINGSEHYYGATYQREAGTTYEKDLGTVVLPKPIAPGVLDLAETGLNLYLAYLLVLLLLFGTFLKKRVIPA
jgi:hypothetical protein